MGEWARCVGWLLAADHELSRGGASNGVATPPCTPHPPTPRPQAKLVLALVSDLPGVTARILALREVLPSLDLAALLAQYPWWVVCGRAGGWVGGQAAGCWWWHMLCCC